MSGQSTDGVSKVTGQFTDLDDDDLAALDHLVERALRIGDRLAA